MAAIAKNGSIYTVSLQRDRSAKLRSFQNVLVTFPSKFQEAFAFALRGLSSPFLKAAQIQFLLRKRQEIGDSLRALLEN